MGKQESVGSERQGEGAAVLAGERDGGMAMDRGSWAKETRGWY